MQFPMMPPLPMMWPQVPVSTSQNRAGAPANAHLFNPAAAMSMFRAVNPGLVVPSSAPASTVESQTAASVNTTSTAPTSSAVATPPTTTPTLRQRATSPPAPNRAPTTPATPASPRRRRTRQNIWQQRPYTVVCMLVVSAIFLFLFLRRLMLLGLIDFDDTEY